MTSSLVKLLKNFKKLIIFNLNLGLGNKKPFVDNNCPLTNCEITNNRNYVNESDAIVFHMGEQFKGLPKWRHASQRWVFFFYESPLTDFDFTEYNGLFNLSLTYKINSNATSLYYAQNPFSWELNEAFDEKYDFFAEKSKFSAIIVSNCNDKSKRLDYINDLKKYIPVDIFGNCGSPCPKKFEGDNSCKLNVMNNYKFYFAFENSICKDYITEKFFGILNYNIIPVVLGGGNYSLFIPKSGYINALDYPKPQDLANYLIYLSSNKEAYNSYFKWKKHVSFNGPRNGHICELCILLNLDVYNGIQASNIGNMKDFWNANNECKIPSRSFFRAFYYF